MHPAPDDIVTAFVTFFVVVDPPGLGPIFLVLTDGLGIKDQRKIGLTASVIAFGVLAGTALIGSWLLRELGIGLPAFRIAGGLLLFTIAFEMVFERRQQRKANDAARASQETAGLAAFPLAIPLMAGPGALTAAILLSGRTGGDPLQLAMLLLVIAVVIFSCFVMFLLAPQLDRLLGRTGQIVFARLLGVMLAALAVQFVVDGVLAISTGPS